MNDGCVQPVELLDFRLTILPRVIAAASGSGGLLTATPSLD